jgi:hypothetical protein
MSAMEGERVMEEGERGIAPVEGAEGTGEEREETSQWHGRWMLGERCIVSLG